MKLASYYCASRLRTEPRSDSWVQSLPEKEAEFPAICNGVRGLLTPRNPVKKAAGSGARSLASVAVVFPSIPV